MSSELLSSNSKHVVLQNILFQEEYAQLAKLCQTHKIPLTALKGISFFGRIYDISERSMTDIDIYIRKEHLARVRTFLVSMGYFERIEEKWEYNFYKTLFVKYHLGLEITFEVHTQLIPNIQYDHWSITPFYNSYILAPQDELIYLSYHYAHQHTLLHPKWLQDIFRISIQHPDIWDSATWKIAKSKQLHSALLFTALSLKCKYQLDIHIPKSPKKFLVSKLLNIDFLDGAHNFPKKYYVAKHLTKDSISAAILYDIKWVIFYFKKRFLK